MTDKLRHRRGCGTPDALPRRDVLRWALTTGTSLGLGAAFAGCKKSSPERDAPGVAAKRPRYYVALLMSGGHDTLYTTDPKLRSEVASDVDLPPDNDITSVGNLRLGRHFAPLEPMGQDLATVNGVQLGTANHDTGIMQFFRLKTNTSIHMPSALDIVGVHRDSQPLGAIYLNLLWRVSHTPRYIGTADRFYHGDRNLLDEVASANPEQLRALGRMLDSKAQSLRREGQRTTTSVTLDNLSQTAKFFERVADVEPLAKQTHSDNYMAQVMGEGFDQALWLIENDLTCGVGVELGLMEWDSHIANHARQTVANVAFVKHFARFMKALQERSNSHGNLAENTIVFSGSDMGRFPRLNDMQGKDHLPQTSFLFAGAGIATGRAYGRTGQNLEALPVSMRTGLADDTGRTLVLDDVGTTVLALAGLDPEVYGYHGAVMSFLLEGRA